MQNNKQILIIFSTKLVKRERTILHKLIKFTQTGLIKFTQTEVLESYLSDHINAYLHLVSLKYLSNEYYIMIPGYDKYKYVTLLNEKL